MEKWGEGINVKSALFLGLKCISGNGRLGSTWIRNVFISRWPSHSSKMRFSCTENYLLNMPWFYITTNLAAFGHLIPSGLWAQIRSPSPWVALHTHSRSTKQPSECLDSFVLSWSFTMFSKILSNFCSFSIFYSISFSFENNHSSKTQHWPRSNGCDLW